MSELITWRIAGRRAVAGDPDASIGSGTAFKNLPDSGSPPSEVPGKICSRVSELPADRERQR